MPSRAAAPSCCVALVLLTLAVPASAWIENHVHGDEVRIEVDAAGKALVEHRITLKTTGSVRLQSYTIKGVDRDAVVEDNSYVIPARDALSNSLDSATPLTMELRHPEQSKPRGTFAEGAPVEQALLPAELVVQVQSERGLRRGSYVLVVRYRTDLRARGLLERDGAMVTVRWTSPIWDDGFDNARVLFVVPAAPTAPRVVDEPNGEHDDDDGVLLPRYLSEVRRAAHTDEVELLRSYLPKGEAVPWAIRVDQRALDPLPAPEQVVAVPAPQRIGVFAPSAFERSWLIAVAVTLWLFYSLLVALKARQVARRARQASAVMPPWVPLPVSLRAVLAGSALTAGVGLQLVADRPIQGSLLVVLAVVLAAHGTARLEPTAAMRGPGRWLTVSEQEGLRPIPPTKGAFLDGSTRLGRLTLLLALSLLAVGVWALWVEWDAPYRAGLVALDSVVLLALWGTGRSSSIPPDLAVEPIRFYRRLTKRIRRSKAGRDLKIVARLRVPDEAVDPDELRLLIVPRLPLRGFAGIEVGLCYVTGFGARVALPEILLRVGQDSACDQAVASLARHGRASPGRKPGERVLAFAPRFPTVRMTSEIVVALAARVRDLTGAQALRDRPTPAARSDRRTAKAAA